MCKSMWLEKHDWATLKNCVPADRKAGRPFAFRVRVCVNAQT